MDVVYLGVVGEEKTFFYLDASKLAWAALFWITY